MNAILIREAFTEEHQAIGELLVSVYSQLEGFPKETEQPSYYEMLRGVGAFTAQPHTALLVAVNDAGALLGAVVYFGDMQYYGSGGTATKEKNAGGFRLLAVAHNARGLGIGKALTKACLAKAGENNLQQVIIHSTMAMQTAWGMYERLGFTRAEEFDFMQGALPVFGFRYRF